jgi:hypothetical protein
VHIHLNFNGPVIGTRQWFDDNHEHIASAMRKAAQNFHPALR